MAQMPAMAHMDFPTIHLEMKAHRSPMAGLKALSTASPGA